VPEIAAALEHPAPAKKPRAKADTVPLPNLKAKSKAKPEPPVPVAEVPPKKPKSSPKPTAPPVSAPELAPVSVENHTITEEELIPASAMETEAPPSAPISVPMRPSRRFQAKQEEMQFEGPPRGRFEKTHETMYRGENLDQPTYRRRGLKIRV